MAADLGLSPGYKSIVFGLRNGNLVIALGGSLAGVLRRIGAPLELYDRPQNVFVAKFIGESNMLEGTYVRDKVVRFMDKEFACIDVGFAEGEKVDVVIRPEDLDIIDAAGAKLVGEVSSSIFRGVHFELCVMVQGKEFVIHTYENRKVGDHVGLRVDSYEIHLMKVERVEH